MRIFSRNPTILLQGNEGNYRTLLSWLSRKKNPLFLYLPCEYITSCPKKIASQCSAISRPILKKKTHIVSQRDRMISSFLVLLLCSTSQRPSLRWQKRRRECVDISTRPSLLLARDNSFWTVLLLLRSFLIVKIWTQQGTDFYLNKCIFSLKLSWRFRVCFSNEHYSISTWLFSPENSHAQLKLFCDYFIPLASYSLAKQATKRLDLLELRGRKMQRTEWKILLSSANTVVYYWQGDGKVGR